MALSKRHELESLQVFVKLLKEKVYKKVADLGCEAWVTTENISFKERKTGRHIALEIGQTWGELFDCGYMNFTGTVPENAIGKKIVLMIDVNGEGCLLDGDGNPIRGITTKASTFELSLGQPVKRVLQFSECAKGGEDIDIWIEVGCNDLFGNYIENGILKQAEVAICNEFIRGIYYDFYFLLNMAESLPLDDTKRVQIMNMLFCAMNVFTFENENSYADAKKILAKMLSDGNADDTLNIWAIGHAHIDLAWLWPIRETKRKCARTLSTVLELMDRYPEYKFGASQPQLFDWMKSDYPKLYERVKEKIKEGRIECQGAMWVEPDTNISGGEALIRQILYGKKFFREEFEKDIDVLWLPDVFGYSGALPQILKKSNVPYFMTIKLSWSEINTFPHHTFIWEGIDGSKVLSHMPPEGTYNSSARPNALIEIDEKFKDKDISKDVLLLFGIGDGGGGPSTDHLEMLMREKNMSHLPAVKQEFSKDFFAHISKNMSKYKKWVGELYLERHQGTYTTQADNKKYNRLLELALRDCEFTCILSKKLAGFDYPKQELETIWKEVLLYQFHDILPGSSKKRVYDESVERYKILLAKVEEITSAAVKFLAESVSVLNDEELFVNTQSFIRKLPDGQKILPYSYKVIKSVEDKSDKKSPAKNRLLENECLKVIFDEYGNIASFYDKENEREILNKEIGTPNLVLLEDMGDAWDIPFVYSEKAPVKLEFVSEVTNSTTIEFTYKTEKSIFVQKVSLDASEKLLNFELEVDWNETNRMLRVRYPVAIHTSQANCNIQFGYITRPTHQNTSWDYAKFEVAAHKWVDISEKGFGISLINSGKYGYKIWDNVLDMNILRSPMYPGINADKGKHTVNYQLFVHNGDIGKVYDQSFKLNSKDICIKSRSDGLGQPEESLIYIEKNNIILEAVKEAEYGDDVIFRLYESQGIYTTTNIKINGMTKAELTNLLEETESITQINDYTIKITFKPFEIQTIKIKC